MNSEIISELAAIGVDTETALNRFMGNINLYTKFLHKFPADDNFAKLKASIDNKDKDGAFMAAHTVKGVAANLGLDSFSKEIEKLVEIFRGVQSYPENEDIDVIYAMAEEKYNEICSVIRKYA